MVYDGVWFQLAFLGLIGYLGCAICDRIEKEPKTLNQTKPNKRVV